MNNKSPTFVFSDPSQIERVDDGIQRQVLGYGPELMAVKVYFDVGAEGYVHKHHHTQVTYVESGEFEMTIGDEVKTLKGGDSFLSPERAHDPHQLSHATRNGPPHRPDAAGN